MIVEDIYVELKYNKNKDEIFDNYIQYISDVSCKEMSVSIEVAYLLYSVLQVMNGTVDILDLGSGFSSYILRKKWNPLLKPTVTTVDDSECWLKRTEEFLRSMKVRTDGLILWDEFKESNKSKYDLIFYDLGCMDKRRRELMFVLDLVKAGGLIVLDDLHKGGYRVEVEREVKRRNLTLTSTKDYTIDSYGRYAKIIIYN